MRSCSGESNRLKMLGVFLLQKALPEPLLFNVSNPRLRCILSQNIQLGGFKLLERDIGDSFQKSCSWAAPASQGQPPV